MSKLGLLQRARSIANGKKVAVASLTVLGIAYASYSEQDAMCGVPYLVQPYLSDICGLIGWGHRPTSIERRAWESLAPHSCEALRAHIERFPDGALVTEARIMLAARQVTKEESWVPGTRRLTLYVGQGDAAALSDEMAREEALARAGAAAERLCRGFAATSIFRLVSATPEVIAWNCRTVSGGAFCDLDGEAVCTLKERVVRESEKCSP